MEYWSAFLTDFWNALLLGVVEGLTEFLPISSTAHLALTLKTLGQDSSKFWKSFEIAIQPGAILSVVVLYWRRLLVDWPVMLRVALAFLPTAVAGLLLYEFGFVKDFLENHDLMLWALALGGVVLILFDWLHKEKTNLEEDCSQITYSQAFWIGCFQSLAIVPGVSRAGATILGGLALGLRRRTAVEFSFLLAVPTMVAATVLDLRKTGGSFQTHEWAILGLGFVVSFLVALLAIKFLLHYIKTHHFWPFGVYRIIFAGIMWLVLRQFVIAD